VIESFGEHQLRNAYFLRNAFFLSCFLAFFLSKLAGHFYLFAVWTVILSPGAKAHELHGPKCWEICILFRG